MADTNEPAQPDSKRSEAEKEEIEQDASKWARLNLDSDNPDGPLPMPEMPTAPGRYPSLL